MPQVPYKGYPDLGPERVPAHVEVPSGIFEGTRALEGFGRALQGAGDELFNRAMALKADQNSTEADEANVQFMTEAGALHAEYGAKQGAERAAAYPAYRDNLVNLRNRIASSMGNDQSRRLFLGKSVGTLGHTIFNGAGEAATAQKEWQNNTAQAEIDAATKTISDNPLDGGLWDNKVAEITAAANKIARLKFGETTPNGPIAQNIAEKNISNAAKERILAVGNVDPPLAREMEKEAITKKQLRGADLLTVDSTLRSRWHTIEAANIGNTAYEENKETPEKLAKPARQVEEEIRAKVRKLEPNNTALAEDAVRVYQNRLAKDNYIDRIEKAANTQVIWESIRDNKPTSMQELKADPKVRAAIEALPAKQQEALEKDLNTNIKNRDLTERLDNFKYLRGLAASNPMAFLEKNLLTEKLTEPDFKDLMNRRDKLIKNPGDDPRVSRAMEWLRSSMGETMVRLNISSSRDGNPEYYKFRGGVQIALDAYQETHGKPPDRKAVQDEIGPTLLKEFTFPGRFFGTNQYPLYKPPTYAASGYEDFARKVRADAAVKGTELNNDQVERMWKRMLYIKAQEKAGGK